MKTMFAFHLAILGFVLTAEGVSQGNSCATAHPIAGFGLTFFDTTQGGQSNHAAGTVCNPYSMGTAFEGFFQWTATEAGDVRFEVSDGSLDLRISAFDGVGCNATCIANGSGGNSPSGPIRFVEIQDVQVGDSILLMIANTAGLVGSGSGQQGVLRVSGAVCNLATATDDPFEPNDTCTSPRSIGSGYHPGLWAHESNLDYFHIIIPPLHTGTVELPAHSGGAPPRVSAFQADCSPAPATFPPLQWTNFSNAPLHRIIEVRPGPQQRCLDYDFEFSLDPVPCYPASGLNDIYENNNDCQSAAQLLPGLHAGLWRAVPGDPDYYWVRVPPLNTLRATIAGTHSGFQLLVMNENCAGYSAEGEQVWVHNDSEVTRDVVLYASLTGDSSGPICGEYAIEIEVEHDLCLEIGPDVMDGTNYTYGLGSGTYRNLFIREADQYNFCVGGNQTLEVDLELQRLVGDLVVELTCHGVPTVCQQVAGSFPDPAVGSSVSLVWQNPTSNRVLVGLAIQYQGGMLPCNRYDLVVRGDDNCPYFFSQTAFGAEQFCYPGNPNSTGQPTQFFARASGPSVGEIYLSAMDGPPGNWGYILAGEALNMPGTSLGNGLLCLDTTGSMGRYNHGAAGLNSLGQFDYLGRFVGPSHHWYFGEYGFVIPSQTPWGQSVFSFGALYFQLWHRDGSGASNLSNAVGVRF